MNKQRLTENEEKILFLIFFEKSIKESEIKKILDWDEKTFTEARDSLLSKELIHTLQQGELQFGKGGNTEALKILVKCCFPLKAAKKPHVGWTTPSE